MNSSRIDAHCFSWISCEFIFSLEVARLESPFHCSPTTTLGGLIVLCDGLPVRSYARVLRSIDLYLSISTRSVSTRFWALWLFLVVCGLSCLLSSATSVRIFRSSVQIQELNTEGPARCGQPSLGASTPLLPTPWRAVIALGDTPFRVNSRGQAVNPGIPDTLSRLNFWPEARDHH